MLFSQILRVGLPVDFDGLWDGFTRSATLAHHRRVQRTSGATHLWFDIRIPIKRQLRVADAVLARLRRWNICGILWRVRNVLELLLQHCVAEIRIL